MKRCFLVILLMSGIVAVYAQQSSAGTSDLPSSAQTKQNAQEYLNQAKSNSSQFESNQEALNASNTSNKDTATFTRLKNEIEKLEFSINAEQAKIKATLDSNSKVTPEIFERVDRLIERHKAKLAELEAFTTAN